jgi:predicted phosphodiesterase
MTRFSFIHISDTHLCIEPLRRNATSLMARRPNRTIDTVQTRRAVVDFLSLAKPASYVPAMLSDAAQFCLENSQVIDGIILTGDLATTGMMADLLPARTFVSAPADQGFLTADRFPTLAASGKSIYVLPGNHDRYVDNRGTPNGKNFELSFGSFLRNFDGSVGHWVRRKADHLIGFVYADFSLQSRMDASDRVSAVYGQGRVKEDTLQALRERTFNVRASYPGVMLVWLLHFAPFDCGYYLHLHNWESVVEAATALKVAVTLCGHTHRAGKIAIGHHIIYCAGSAACVDSEGDGKIHVIHLDTDGVSSKVSRMNYRWNRDMHEFFLDSED